MRFVKLVPVLVGLFAGCASDTTVGPNLGDTVGPEYDGLRLEVSFPRTASLGDSIRFDVRLTNLEHQPLYEFAIPYFDVFVLGSDGEVVWNHYHGGANALSGGQEITLRPGESFEITIPWNLNRNGQDGAVTPGVYRVLAAFIPSVLPVIVTSRLDLVITPE